MNDFLLILCMFPGCNSTTACTKPWHQYFEANLLEQGPEQLCYGFSLHCQKLRSANSVVFVGTTPFADSERHGCSKSVLCGLP